MRSDELHCVIGSGPAGVACAHALLERGVRVRLLDAGVNLEEGRAAVVAEMSHSAPGQWKKDSIGLIKEGARASSKGIPLKMLYGSDYPYRETKEHIRADYRGVGVRPSLARGGLSTVWGAAMLPFLERDMEGWVVRVAELAPHYEAVTKLTGLSARKDRLEHDFPLYARDPGNLELSRQAKTLLAGLEEHHPALTQAGIFFGRSRLAVAASHQSSPGCVYCGFCMYGCPYGYIYTSTKSLNELQQKPNFSYQPDVVVVRVRETGSGISIEGYSRLDRTPVLAQAARVYLAAGVLPSTQIVLRSTDTYDETVFAKDSQYFLLPLLLRRGTAAVREEPLHTVSQLFLEIFDASVSPHTVHLQVYSYNDLIGQALGNVLGPLRKPLDFLARAMENRLMVIQGYLHSAHSSQIAIALKPGSSGGPDGLLLEAKPNPETRPMIRRVIRKLMRHRRDLGAWPLPFLLQVAEAGRGFHCGGTLPMQAEPGRLQTDRLGRPSGWQRLHVVDASVLPGIPATTITFSAMANAHRIGWESAALNPR